MAFNRRAFVGVALTIPIWKVHGPKKPRSTIRASSTAGYDSAVYNVATYG